MSLPLLTAVAPRWEAALAGLLDASRRVHVARRCADVAELLGVAAAGTGRLAVVSADLRGLDRSVVEDLRGHGLLVLGVHPPEDEAARRLLLRWGVPVVVPADVAAAGLDEALRLLLEESEGVGPADDERTDAQVARRRRGAGSAVPAPTSDLDATTTGGTTGGEVPATGQGGRPEGARTADPDGPPGAPEDAHAGPDDEPDAQGEVVVVWGPTGSPGRTTLAVNLAVELADPLSPTVLVDADTYGASAAQVLAVLDEVPGVAAAARAADQGTLTRGGLAQLAPEVRPGLRLLTGLPRADRWPEVRDVALADVLDRCRALARWVVVDVAAPVEQDEDLSFDTTAPRRNGATLTALEAADRVVVVGTGDPVGLQRLVRGLDLLTGATTAPRTVVVTRVRPGPVGPEPGRRIQEALDRFAAVGPVHLVPEDQDALDTALLHGRALVEVRPRSPARLAIAELARHLAGPEAAPVPGRAAGRRRPWWGRRTATA
ncbi:AAA family ATPase [Ornithinimicrobium avium]|uniref:MinD-like ATPase involved in chromosome partitioning or flagellar assembly n=1 Tax=Ornithinimicrobium avium TaxID=2283195 RepID=A0A345NLA9_9MICO|nr:hypothetical protein [Ornithinimicrobium avium]AXH95817.1 hypothetical protein DV701_06460 [Ornithinimicrobium avium]